MDERRQLPRWAIKKETKVWLPEAQGFSHCVIEDMHLKGMCVSCDKKVFQQQVVSMSFSLENNFDMIKIEAHIPWAKQEAGRYVYGLSFYKINEFDKDKLYQQISAYCYEQFKDKWWRRD